jgi:hypothetical protein
VTDPAGQWIVNPPVQEYRRPCVVVPNPEDFRLCGARSGEHTILDLPLCDECYEAIRL